MMPLAINSADIIHTIEVTEYVPNYRVYFLRNGFITIELYANSTLKDIYYLILEFMQLHVKNRSAKITILTHLGYVSWIYIQPIELQPNFVGVSIPKKEIFLKVDEIVKKYYPNFEYRQFHNGFMFRPLGFIKPSHLNTVLSELIPLYNGNLNIWLTAAFNRGYVISY